MGITHVIHEIDPERAREAASRMPVGDVGTSPADVLDALPEFDLDQSGFDNAEEFVWEYEEADPTTIFNAVLLLYSSQRSWAVDKAPNTVFRAAAKIVPALAPVVDFFWTDEFGPVSEDLRVPDSGLTAIHDHDAIARIRGLLDDWPEERLRKALQNYRPGLLDRIGGRANRAAELLHDDYFWQAWRDLGAAVESASSHQAWLGIESG